MMMSAAQLLTVQAAWERYVAGPEPVPDRIAGVRQEIVDSWKRSKGSVDPFTAYTTLSSEKFQEIRRENDSLVRIARPYLHNLFLYLKESGHQITIVNKDGCILDTIFDGTGDQEPPGQYCIGNGSIFSEKYAGTTGISLSYLSRKPAVVVGPEHFKKSNHDSICYTAPVHDQFRKLIGFVDISGPITSYQSSTLSMLQSSVQGIEREFSFRQVNAVLTATLNAFSEGILVLDANKLIIHYNSKARDVLQVGKDKLIGQSIYSVLRQDSLPVMAQSLNREISSMECTILNRYQTPLDVSLSVIPTAGNDLGITLIEIKPLSEMARLSYRGNDFSTKYTFDAVQGVSPGIQSLKALGRVAATTSVPVMIFGESGTGKEVLAQAIHNSSEWGDGPFISMDCSKIPRGLLESELFGYEGGVFGGGKENGYMSKFEQANGGTLFLSEISYLPQDAQEALVNILKTGSVTRLGGKYPKSISFKLIVATTVNLLNAVQRKNFRADLYYQLNGFTLTIPPLRERTEDIMPTVIHFMEAYCFKVGKPVPALDPEVVAALNAYRWPNNIREVETTVEEILHIADAPVICLSDLPTGLLSDYYASINRRGRGEGEPDYVDHREHHGDEGGAPLPQVDLEDYQRILDVIRANQGSVKQTASVLNIPLSTLYYKLKKYGLNPKDYKTASRRR